MPRGHYIILEGIDYTGKTTLAKRLTDWIKEKGHQSLYTRHPGSTHLGKELRRLTREEDLDPNTEALLFAVDNSAFTYQILAPAIDDGTWVVADRNNFVSSLAYQIANGCELKDLDRIHATIPRPPKADILVILTADRDEITRRARTRVEEGGRDRFGELMERDDYFQKVAQAYREMVDRERNVSLRLTKFVKRIQTHTRFYALPHVVEVSTNEGEERAFEDLTKAIKRAPTLRRYFPKEER